MMRGREGGEREDQSELYTVKPQIKDIQKKRHNKTLYKGHTHFEVLNFPDNCTVEPPNKEHFGANSFVPCIYLQNLSIKDQMPGSTPPVISSTLRS